MPGGGAYRCRSTDRAIRRIEVVASAPRPSVTSSVACRTVSAAGTCTPRSPSSSTSVVQATSARAAGVVALDQRRRRTTTAVTAGAASTASTSSSATTTRHGIARRTVSRSRSVVVSPPSASRGAVGAFADAEVDGAAVVGASVGSGVVGAAQPGTVPARVAGVGSNRIHPTPSKYSSGQAWASCCDTR